MPNLVNASDIHLDHIHNAAVREGIGERLRDVIRGPSTDMPQRIRDLIARLPEIDHDAPPLVPDMATLTRAD